MNSAARTREVRMPKLATPLPAAAVVARNFLRVNLLIDSPPVGPSNIQDFRHPEVLARKREPRRAAASHPSRLGASRLAPQDDVEHHSMARTASAICAGLILQASSSGGE